MSKSERRKVVPRQQTAPGRLTFEVQKERKVLHIFQKANRDGFVIIFRKNNYFSIFFRSLEI